MTSVSPVRPAFDEALDLVIVHREHPGVETTVKRFLDQGVRLRVVVVDNGSAPALLENLRRDLPPEVHLLALGSNRGFGPAANAGIRWLADHQPAPWVAVAPHDAAPYPGCLAQLLAVTAEDTRRGLASADVGDALTPVVDPYFGGIPAASAVARGWEAAGYPHGTLLLARRACLDDIGLFDERYFAYCEEADLGLRARAAGWDVGVVRGADVRNTGLGSGVPVIDYLQLRNTLLLVREASGRYHAAIRLTMALWHLGAGLAMADRRGPYWAPRARVHAIVDFLRGRFGPPPPHLVAPRVTAPLRPAPPPEAPAEPCAGTGRR